ncbi:MAG: hypothetical protein ACYDCC_05885 [Actinomycetota bacterium]
MLSVVNGGATLAVFLFIAVVLGLIPAYMAKNKGYSFGLFWFFGFLSFLITLIVVLVISPKDGASGGSSGTCPLCAERVSSQATVCKHCHNQLPVRPCPSCQRPFLRTGGKCPWCNSQSSPWRYFSGRWFSIDPGGVEYVLSQDETKWEPTGRKV